ncbi:hypothetical protein BDV18DRAFT_157202 [Aspergillus unguis]
MRNTSNGSDLRISICYCGSTDLCRILNHVPVFQTLILALEPPRPMFCKCYSQPVKEIPNRAGVEKLAVILQTPRQPHNSVTAEVTPMTSSRMFLFPFRPYASPSDIHGVNGCPEIPHVLQDLEPCTRRGRISFMAH